MPFHFVNRARMAAWEIQADRHVSELPGSDEGLSAEDLAREGGTSFSQFSTWAIVCEEVLDTQFSRAYFERAREEFHRRGIADDELTEMRRFAWLTAGWLNFDQGLWDWCHLDEKDIRRAIEMQHAGGFISDEERDRRMAYLERYADADADANTDGDEV